ncbi:uncharacterized protein BDZ99DRAFT_548568 [Mytilinidion resinicola]|uniref:Uncharacterized protein n=1 Tax=Mytilinidion resinicola TaxID=574789 RepID=A0A6A6Z344_9PEZI|nr:uncharacterized protein BDZ99DRAFT_548568 [Mytilinidion resinicola]KAF2814575.1 hypothetical protein BDZ99DRAFT_548568 [Mytilinidion resinicola]
MVLPVRLAVLTSSEGVEMGAQVDMYTGPDPAARPRCVRSDQRAVGDAWLARSWAASPGGFRHNGACARVGRVGAAREKDRSRQHDAEGPLVGGRWAGVRRFADTSPVEPARAVHARGRSRYSWRAAGGMQEGMIRREPRWLSPRRSPWPCLLRAANSCSSSDDRPPETSQNHRGRSPQDTPLLRERLCFNRLAQAKSSSEDDEKDLATNIRPHPSELGPKPDHGHDRLYAPLPKRPQEVSTPHDAAVIGLQKQRRASAVQSCHGRRSALNRRNRMHDKNQ